MNDTVVIKGSKSGIILVLSPDASYETLKKMLLLNSRLLRHSGGLLQRQYHLKGMNFQMNRKMRL